MLLIHGIAIKQDHARQHSLPIDSLVLTLQVLDKEPDQAPKAGNGTLISGLYLEGASWDGSALVEPSPSELYAQLPVVLLSAKATSEEDKTGIYNCPVYRTTCRKGVMNTSGQSSNYVFSADLPCSKTERHWVRRRAALFTSWK